MFKIYLSRTVSPGVGVNLPATIEKMRETYSLLSGAGTVPLGTATTYTESFTPNLRRYLCEIPVSEKKLEKLNCLAYHVKRTDSQDKAISETETEIVTAKPGKLYLNMIRVSIIECRIYL